MYIRLIPFFPFFLERIIKLIREWNVSLFSFLYFFCLQSPEQLFVYIIVFKRNDLTCEHWNYGQPKGRKMSRGMLAGDLI